MTQSLSADLRGRVIAAIEEGLSTRKGGAAVSDRDRHGGSLVSPLPGDRRDGSPQAGPAVAIEA